MPEGVPELIAAVVGALLAWFTKTFIDRRRP